MARVLMSHRNCIYTQNCSLNATYPSSMPSFLSSPLPSSPPSLLNPSCACLQELFFVSAHPLSLASCCLVSFYLDLFIRGGVIRIHRISRPIYSGIPRNIDHRRHGPSMQYFLLHSQIHINHFGSIYPFRSLESLMTSLDVVSVMF